MDEKAEVVDAEVVNDSNMTEGPLVAEALPGNMTEAQYEGLKKDLQAYQEERRAAWINTCKNRAAHQAKVSAKRLAAKKAAKKARKIQRKRK